MNFTVKAFAELSPAELHAIYTARVAVFVVEQACPYQEVDAQDLTALHIFAEQNGKVIAYCRRQRAFGARAGVARASRRKTGAQNRRLCRGLRPRAFPAMQRLCPSASLSGTLLRLVWICQPIRPLSGRQYSAY